MNFKRLKTSDNNRYMKAMDLYKASFPAHEQRESDSQIRIMEHENYHFNLIYDEDFWVGMILLWETEEFIYVEHFCILSEMRNKQYGQRALELLNEVGKTVILEIDPPINEIAIHRKAFYERSGYQANEFAHVHPPYHRGFDGHNLIVMSCPDLLSETNYNRFNDYIKYVVMGN